MTASKKKLKLKRIHLFEFEDFKWFPSFIRDGGRDFLGFFLKHTKFYKPSVKLLEDAIKKTSHKQVSDLCAGNGGPIESINQEIDAKLNIKFILSDKYPNYDAYSVLKNSSNNKIDYHRSSVDVLKMNNNISGFRTIFSAIHHFEPKEVNTILNQNIESKMPTPLPVFIFSVSLQL